MVALLDVDESDLVRAIDDLVGEGVVATLVPDGLAAAGGKRLVQAQHIPGAGGRGEGGHIHRQRDGGRGGGRWTRHSTGTAWYTQRSAAIRRSQRVQPDRPGSLAGRWPSPGQGRRSSRTIRTAPFEALTTAARGPEPDSPRQSRHGTRSPAKTPAHPAPSARRFGTADCETPGSTAWRSSSPSTASSSG